MKKATKKGVCNTINVREIIRDNCGGLCVSPGAVCELRGRIVMSLERTIPDICSLTRKHKRKTVFADDVVEYYGMTNNRVVPELDK